MGRQEFASIQLNSGRVFNGKKIGELTAFIINKFSEENLSCDEARIILDSVKDVMGECSTIKSMD
ncbi:MAG: hypothetical protein E7K23_10855 [Lachnospiraceae bacterium]|nr:hypothetical protein [Clostridiales bacterium]MDU7632850.1 hypothetical protein [Lachnospiraceae bacterium]DAI14089.1 MAG TPA: hypothetical protein [Caudoviricetes sp.]